MVISFYMPTISLCMHPKSRRQDDSQWQIARSLFFGGLYDFDLVIRIDTAGCLRTRKQY